MSAEPTMDKHQPNRAESLLIEIARCPVVDLCLEQREGGDWCRQIVQSQGVSTVREFQVPEPWSGPIESAPILFLSSNPSISRSNPPRDTDEEYPTGDRETWPDERIIDFFQGRFGGGREEWIRNGIRGRMKNGEFSKDPKDWVRFWASAKARASEALGRPAIPGRDYAMTEVVRCKSVEEYGGLDCTPNSEPR